MLKQILFEWDWLIMVFSRNVWLKCMEVFWLFYFWSDSLRSPYTNVNYCQINIINFHSSCLLILLVRPIRCWVFGFPFSAQSANHAAAKLQNIAQRATNHVLNLFSLNFCFEIYLFQTEFKVLVRMLYQWK